MPRIINAIAIMNHKNRKIDEFTNFNNECIKQLNEAEELVQNIEDILSEQQKMYMCIFGMQVNDLNQLVKEIQTSTEWNVLDVGNVDLPKLNSHCVNKNRRRLRKWLLTERPTENLKHFLEPEDQIKETILNITESVQAGREYIKSLHYDPEKNMRERDRYIKGGDFDASKILKKLTERAKNQLNSWTDFVNKWTCEYNKDASCFSEFIVTIKDLMSWRSLQHSIPIINPRKQKAYSPPVKRSYYILLDINEEGGETVCEVPMSEDEISLEIEANKLKMYILHMSKNLSYI